MKMSVSLKKIYEVHFQNIELTKPTIIRVGNISMNFQNQDFLQN